MICRTCKDRPCPICDDYGTVIERYDNGIVRYLICDNCFGEACPSCGKGGTGYDYAVDEL